MFNRNYQYYPLGFRTTLREGMVKSEIEPDAELIKLLGELESGVRVFNSWETHSKILRIASRLFGNFYDWLFVQETNEKISTNGYAFIQDTLHFIQHGKRPVDSSARTLLIAQDYLDGVYKNANSTTRDVKLTDSMKYQTSDYLHLWASWENGISDILCTITTLFGYTKSAA